MKKVKKEIIFFDQKPPKDQSAIHIWLGKEEVSHDMHLRQILKEYLGVSSFKLITSSKGKQHLQDFPLHFNLSDSHGWLAIALSWEAPVGIDIESIRPIEEMDQMTQDYFSLDEQKYVKDSKNESLLRFWEVWSRKEACLKALGIGLQDHMDKWDCFGKGWILVNDIWVRSVPTQKDLSLAVAIEARKQ